MSVFTSNWLVLFPIAFSLFVAMRLAMGSVDFGRKSWMMLAVRSAVLLLFWFSFLSLGLRANWLSIPWTVIAAGFVGVMAFKRRKLERIALLQSMMTVERPALQQQMARYFVADNDGYVRRKASGLLQDLLRGVPLARSLEVRGVAAGVYERLAVRLKDAYGIRSQAVMAGAGVKSPAQIEFEIERLLGRLMIFSWVVLLVPVLMLFFRFVMPTFWALFEEFNVDMPAGMASLEDWFYAFQFGWLATLGAGLMFGLTVGLVLLGGSIVLLWLFPRALQLPLFRWLCNDYYRTAGFVTLGHVLEHEPNVMLACQRTAELMPVSHVSRNFLAAHDALQAGKGVAEALQSAKLLTRQESRVWGGVKQSNPAWALTQLASWKVDRMLARYALLVQFLVLGLTLSLAAVVGWFAYGVIQVLTNLVMSLS